MKKLVARNGWLKKSVILATALALVFLWGPVIDWTDTSGQAIAKEADSGKGGKAFRGGQEHGSGKSGQAVSGGAKGVEGKVLSEEDEGDESDRPDWAMGNREANPHARGGAPPEGSGTKKGDLYGDLYVVDRDAEDGLPILYDCSVDPCVASENGTELLVKTIDANGVVTWVYTVDGELPELGEGVSAVEVELGRLSVSRSPNHVTDKSLDEVLKKLDSATTVELDPAGRLVIDGTTVDSPLENLALYTAFMTGEGLTEEQLAKLPTSDLLSLAPSLLAAASDKTGEISIDLVMYQDAILGIADPGEPFQDPTFSYDRTTAYTDANGDLVEITYFQYADESNTTVVQKTATILDAVFDGDPASGTGVTGFAQAADDALQVIEFVHTAIQPYEAP